MADLTVSADIDTFMSGGVLKVPDGTAALPSMTFTSAPTTGISLVGGQLCFSRLGVLKAYFSTSNIWVVTIPTGLNGISGASTPVQHISGTWYTLGDSTTAKAHVLIEPAGTTSTGWHTGGTGLGINAAAAFGGRLIDCQLNGVSQFRVGNTGGVVASLYAVTANTGTYSFGTSNDIVLSRLGAANLRLGSVPSDTPLPYTLTIGEASRPGTDSNVAGANGTIQSGLGTGTGAASSLIFQTPTTVGAGSTVQTYTTRLTLSPSGTWFGAVSASSRVLSGGSFEVSAGNHFMFASGAAMSCPSNGIITLFDAAFTNFTRLQFGGTTAAFPALRRTTTALNVRLADDSADAALTALSYQSAAPAGGTSGVWKLGVAASVTPTSPNRTIEVEIGGTIYYLHAKTTNN